MPTLRAIGTAVPDYVVTRSDAQTFAEAFFAGHFKDIHRFMHVFANAEIDTRYTSAPLSWFEKPHTFAEKNALYVETALKLAETAIRACLTATELAPADIDEIVFVSSTGIAAPSLDAHLLNRLRMNSHLRRTPIWGLGCAGGAGGLARGFDLARGEPRHRILVVAVELCSLTFQHSDKSKSNLIATALFGDGAAAVLIEGDDTPTMRLPPEHRTLKFVDSTSVTWPETLDVMGWNLSENGLDVIFSRDIPTLVDKYLRDEVTSFLAANGLCISDISVFAAHPGGKKVLDAYQAVFQSAPEALQFSHDILREFGNMSAPTVLFVLKEALQAPSEENAYVLAFALGPGFTCEQVLLQWS